MCYYNKCKVTRAGFIRLKAIEKELKNLKLNRPVQSGFDYSDWPIIVPIHGGKDFEIKNVHWEYIPAFVKIFIVIFYSANNNREFLPLHHPALLAGIVSK
jgi:hypothetical protein